MNIPINSKNLFEAVDENNDFKKGITISCFKLNFSFSSAQFQGLNQLILSRWRVYNFSQTTTS